MKTRNTLAALAVAMMSLLDAPAATATDTSICGLLDAETPAAMPSNPGAGNYPQSISTGDCDRYEFDVEASDVPLFVHFATKPSATLPPLDTPAIAVAIYLEVIEASGNKVLVPVFAGPVPVSTEVQDNAAVPILLPEGSGLSGHYIVEFTAANGGNYKARVDDTL